MFYTFFTEKHTTWLDQSIFLNISPNRCLSEIAFPGSAGFSCLEIFTSFEANLMSVAMAEYRHPEAPDRLDSAEKARDDVSNKPTASAYRGHDLPEGEGRIQSDRLNRALSARQVQMIAIGGTIGTGLFLGTGKSLVTGGPASMLICYAIVGAIVFVTMLSLGEMAAFIPVAGSFCTFAG
jgi:AAT family amino acid transporter